MPLDRRIFGVRNSVGDAVKWAEIEGGQARLSLAQLCHSAPQTSSAARSQAIRCVGPNQSGRMPVKRQKRTRFAALTY